MQNKELAAILVMAGTVVTVMVGTGPKKVQSPIPSPPLTPVTVVLPDGQTGVVDLRTGEAAIMRSR